jgi:hypothetical protein
VPVEVNAAATACGVLLGSVFHVILWASRNLLPVYADGTVTVHAPSVVRPGSRDISYSNFLPPEFVLATDDVFAPLLAAQH